MKKTLIIIATSIVIISQTLPLTVKATTANNPNLSSVNADVDFTYASGTYTDHFGYQTTTASYGPDIKLGKKIQARFSYNSTHVSASSPITMTFKPTNGTFDLQDLASSLEIGTSYDITANSMDGAIQTSLSSEKYTVSTDASTNTLTVSIPVSTISEVGSDFIVLFTLTPNMDNYNGSDAFSNGLDTTYDDGQSSQSGSWWTVIKVPQVTINAIDEDTNTTLSTNQASDLVDYQSQYTADAPDITNYTLDDSKGPTPSIGVNDSLSGDKVVNFYYTKDPVAGGDVTAKYVDTAGNKISDDVVKSGNVGDTYSTDQKTIAGYTFKEVQGSATGTFTDQAQTVTYVYTKDPVAGGDVTAKYIDTAGNKISDDVMKSGNVGDTYSTDQKTIAGYTFKEVQGSATGTFTDQAQTVTYVYTKDSVAGGDVTAKYVDTDGNKISDDVVKSGNVGDAYSIDQKLIDGYTFKEVQGSATGTFTDQAQTVTYVYKKDPIAGGDVTAKYVDTDGNKISDDVVKSGNVGDAYSTDQKLIDGYTFKEVQGSTTGTFTVQAQTVTYVYTKNNVTPNPKPDDDSGTPEGSKKNDSTSENKSKLPQTGDNEGLSMIGMISGIFLILGTIVMILVKRKRQD